LHRPDAPRQRLHRPGNLLLVQRVIDSPVTGESSTKLGGQPFGGILADQTEAHVGQRGGGGDEAHRRRREKRGDEHRRAVLGLLRLASC
jgi:hypothetical protein